MLYQKYKVHFSILTHHLFTFIKVWISPCAGWFYINPQYELILVMMSMTNLIAFTCCVVLARV
jgi:hypothetical protein